MVRVFVALIAVAQVCLCHANVGQELKRQAGEDPSPNELLDDIVDEALDNIIGLGWDEKKKIQNGETAFPFNVTNDEVTADPSQEKFSITKGFITGLASLRRSAAATYNDDESELTGTLVVEYVCAEANYEIEFPGAGAAQQQSVNGVVKECVEKLFADLTVTLSNLVPQNIISYAVRSGSDTIKMEGIAEGNDMRPLHQEGARKALRQLLEKTMATNIKVQVNRAIQTMRNGA